MKFNIKFQTFDDCTIHLLITERRGRTLYICVWMQLFWQLISTPWTDIKNITCMAVQSWNRVYRSCHSLLIDQVANGHGCHILIWCVYVNKQVTCGHKSSIQFIKNDPSSNVEAKIKQNHAFSTYLSYQFSQFWLLYPSVDDAQMFIWIKI